MVSPQGCFNKGSALAINKYLRLKWRFQAEDDECNRIVYKEATGVGEIKVASVI